MSNLDENITINICCWFGLYYVQNVINLSLHSKEGQRRFAFVGLQSPSPPCLCISVSQFWCVVAGPHTYTRSGIGWREGAVASQSKACLADGEIQVFCIYKSLYDHNKRSLLQLFKYIMNQRYLYLFVPLSAYQFFALINLSTEKSKITSRLRDTITSTLTVAIRKALNIDIYFLFIYKLTW